jgi:hypothetical protein
MGNELKRLIKEACEERAKKEAIIIDAVERLDMKNPGDLREAVFMMVDGWMGANGYSKADKVVFYKAMQIMQKTRR